jgi:hypothetical protein
VLFCRESPTVPFGGDVDEDEIVFPGDGVPEQAGGVQVYVSPDVGLTVFDILLRDKHIENRYHILNPFQSS